MEQIEAVTRHSPAPLPIGAWVGAQACGCGQQREKSKGETGRTPMGRTIPFNTWEARRRGKAVVPAPKRPRRRHHTGHEKGQACERTIGTAIVSMLQDMEGAQQQPHQEKPDD